MKKVILLLIFILLFGCSSIKNEDVELVSIDVAILTGSQDKRDGVYFIVDSSDESISIIDAYNSVSKRKRFELKEAYETLNVINLEDYSKDVLNKISEYFEINSEIPVIVSIKDNKIIAEGSGYKNLDGMNYFIDLLFSFINQ